MLPAVIKRIFPFLINLLLEELTTKFRALHNEHVSIEAKEHAEQMLQKLNEEEARHELLEGGEHLGPGPLGLFLVVDGAVGHAPAVVGLEHLGARGIAGGGPGRLQLVADGGLAGVLVSMLNNGQAGLGIAAGLLAVAAVLLVGRRRARVRAAAAA